MPLTNQCEAERPFFFGAMLQSSPLHPKSHSHFKVSSLHVPWIQGVLVQSFSLVVKWKILDVADTVPTVMRIFQ